MKKLLVIPALAMSLAGAALHGQSYTFSTASTVVYSTAGVVVDASGAIYVASLYGNTVSKLAPTGALVAQYGSSVPGTGDGTGTAARFNFPRGLALDPAGNLFVADSNNHSIRKITPAGVVSTFAGSPGNLGSNDGPAATARFYYPQGLAFDRAGNLYVADTNNHAIRRITPAGIVTTFAGALRESGSADGTGAAARFNLPLGLASESGGNLYVADTSNHTIRRITADAVVTTYAGSALNQGSSDGLTAAARFKNPWAVAVDAAGTVFVADTGNFTLRRIAGGAVATVAGLAGVSGSSSGVGSAARFYGLRGVAVDASGSLFVTDDYLRLGAASGQLAITVQPQSLSVGTGSTAKLSVTATGASPITYQWQKNGSTIAGATLASFAIPAVQTTDAATYTVTVTNPLGTLASTGATLTAVAAVPNDNFANAQAISGASGDVSGSNNGATGEPGEPTHFSPAATASSVWYKWTPTGSGTAVGVLNGAVAVNLGVWVGNSVGSLTRVAVGNPYTAISFRIQSGTTYYFAVGSNAENLRGNFTLSWHTIPNDDFADAQALTGNSGFLTGNANGATREANDPVGPPYLSSTLWYKWTPTQSGTAMLGLTGSVTGMLCTGTSLATLQPLPSALHVSLSSIGMFVTSRVANVSAGTTYYLAVGSSSGWVGPFEMSWSITPAPLLISASGNRTVLVGASVAVAAEVFASFPPVYQWLRDGTPIPGATGASLTLEPVQLGDAGSYRVRVTGGPSPVEFGAGTLTVLVPPANDNFARAAAITGLTGSINGTNVNATGETGEPAHWNLTGTATSVWYQWTPAASGLAAIDTVGSAFDTVLAVYSGPATATAALTNLTRLIQDDDRGGGRTSQVSFAATAGTSYYVAVGGATSGARGSLRLNWQLTPTLAVTVPPASQTVIAGGSATFTVTASGSGVTYQWSRNGTPIPGATNPSLTVTNLASGADASFTATVTNSTGAITSAPATLTVAAPSFTNLTVRNSRTGGGLLWSIASMGNLLVAVGDGGNILASPGDGRSWTPRASGTTSWLVGVTSGAGRFVAVGDRGLILWSLDGSTWTPAAASSTSFRMNNVIFADGKFVAVGEGGTILTSADANTWTPRVSGVTTWLHGLAYHAASGTFATCGESGVVLLSSDAITWTKLPVTGLAVHLEALVAVNSYAQFVAAGHNGTIVGIRRDSLVLKDGGTLVTWSGEVTATGSTSNLVGLATGGGALFAAGSGGKILTATSDKGPWYSLPSAGDGILLGGLFFNDTLFLVGEKETVLQSDPIYLSRLRNISTRGEVGTGGNLMISGFIVRGDRPKTVLVRAAGPALAAFGVSGTLAAPVLTVLDSKAAVISTNTGWSTAANAAAIASTAARVSAFPFTAGSADCALLATLSPGEYTVQVSGVGISTGLCLVEVYDTDPIDNTGAQAVNISTRGLAGAGASTMIAGFIIEGAATRRVLIRAVGPGLTPFGVAGVLAEPTLELYNGRGLLHATGGTWGLQANADEIRGAFEAAGAFKLAEGSKDAAMVISLPPGNWTVQVGGAGAAAGVALIEVYALP